MLKYLLLKTKTSLEHPLHAICFHTVMIHSILMRISRIQLKTVAAVRHTPKCNISPSVLSSSSRFFSLSFTFTVGFWCGHITHTHTCSNIFHKFQIEYYSRAKSKHALLICNAIAIVLVSIVSFTHILIYFFSALRLYFFLVFSLSLQFSFCSLPFFTP